MKIYRKVVYILLLLYITIYPILPTYGIISADTVLYLLALLYILSLLLFNEERIELISLIKNIVNNPCILIISCINILMYLSTFIATDKHIALTNSIRFSMYIFVFYLIAYKLKELTAIFKCLIFTGFLSGIFSISQIIYTLYLGYSIDPSIRIPSFLENPNNLSAYSILLIFIVISLLINTKYKKKKFLYLVLIILLLINIIFSQSRSALLSIIIGFMLFYILWNKKYLVISLFIPIILFILPQSRVRFLQTFDTTQNSSRFKIWEITKLMIKDNLLTGVGYENFSVDYPIYINNYPEYSVHDEYLALHPHNIFLKIQVELGILGSILFVLLILSIIYTFYKIITNSVNNDIKVLTIGFGTSFISFGLMNLIDCYIGAPKVIITFFILLGILTYIKNNLS